MIPNLSNLVKGYTSSDRTATKELAADLILTNLLGEKLKIRKLDFIDVVEKFDDEKGITELKYLPAQLRGSLQYGD